MFRINTQVINPALLILTPGHDRADYLSLLEGNQKELRLDLAPGSEVSDGVIVWRCTGEYFVPEFEYALLVFLAKRPDGYIQGACQDRELTCRQNITGSGPNILSRLPTIISKYTPQNNC
jgi:hypothetical protein